MKLAELLINCLTEKHSYIPLESILGISQYGSRVYGTASENSDWDFVVIHSSYQEGIIETDDYDIHYIPVESYINMLKEHDIMALEIYYHNLQNEPIKEFNIDESEYDFEFVLDKQKLRHSVSKVSSNSFVKFKKKLTLPNEDNYIGIKSLFHAVRIADLGYAIATGSRKVLETDTYFWKRIKEVAEESNYNWEIIHKEFKPIHNATLTEFRTVTPKEQK